MIDGDREQFVVAMMNLAAYYSQVQDRKIELSEGVLEMLWDDLREFELVEVLSALKRHRRDPQWGHRMPLSSDLLRHIRGSPEDRAALAWSKALDAARRHGAYTSVVFDDPAIGRVVEEMGGWIYFCNLELDEWDQKEFVRRYAHYCEVGLREAPVKLLGRHEAENRSKGYLDVKNPLAFIGDPDKARKRLESGDRGYAGREGAARAG